MWVLVAGEWKSLVSIHVCEAEFSMSRLLKAADYAISREADVEQYNTLMVLAMSQVATFE